MSTARDDAVNEENSASPRLALLLAAAMFVLVVDTSRWLHGPNISPRRSSRSPSPAAGRTSRAWPHGHAAWHLFSVRTPISWKPRRGFQEIGYAPDLAVTGLHALDGARYLRDVQHADAMMCRLVAHHSYAIVEADERGLADVLGLEFEPAPHVLSSVLTCCDMTTSPDGELVPVDAGY